MSKPPVRVAVTGAAGQIGYALLFRIASGEMLGKDQPVILQLLEVPVEGLQKALKGVMMELDDCAFPLLAGMEAHSDPMTAFKDTDYALLVGSRPRGPGMERAELLAVNGAIFTAQGKALNAVASRNVKVLVVGNPANTNAYIAMKSAPDLPRKNFTAMLRLDHNRAASQIAAKTGKPVVRIHGRRVVAPDGEFFDISHRFTGFCRNLAGRAVVVQTQHGREVFSRQVRRAFHGDVCIGVGGVAHHQHLDVTAGHGIKRLALRRKNGSINRQQFCALHARATRT